MVGADLAGEHVRRLVAHARVGVDREHDPAAGPGQVGGQPSAELVADGLPADAAGIGVASDPDPGNASVGAPRRAGRELHRTDGIGGGPGGHRYVRSSVMATAIPNSAAELGWCACTTSTVP